MITEDYVSFETAKLLKEKGFYGECLSMYLTPKPNCGMGNPYEAKLAPHGRDSHYYDGHLYQCEAPTLQMAMKWLREVHNIHIEIRYSRYSNTYHYKIIYGPTELDDYVSKPHVLRTYEEAAEESIKHCLEMLVK